MNKLLLFVLIVLLSGCSVLKQNPDVVEVPDDVWQKVKKQAEERRKADEAQRKSAESQELEKLNKALDQFKAQERSHKE
jgi:beta-lactam-binding protein with PASTA domain